MHLTIGAIIRDAESSIIDWIVHHHIVGFDRFVCVLHKTIDKTGERLKFVKEKLGLDIIIHHCDTYGKVQMGVYQWIHDNYGNDTEWILFLDEDEYVYHINPTVDYRDDIKNLLSGLSYADSISFHGKIYGPSGIIRKPDMRYAYNMRIPLNDISCKSIKTFYKPSKLVRLISPHIQEVEGYSIRFDGNGFTLVDGWRTLEEPIFSPVCYDHYYTGCVQDWIDRFKRGSCNDPRPNHAYSSENFFSYTGSIMEKDESRRKYFWWHNNIMRNLFDDCRKNR